jgi:hypothetical protein
MQEPHAHLAYVKRGRALLALSGATDGFQPVFGQAIDNSRSGTALLDVHHIEVKKRRRDARKT